MQTAVGTVGMGYSLSEGYTNLSATDHEQELDQQVSLSFPLVSSTKLGNATALSLFTSATDTLRAEDRTFSPSWTGWAPARVPRA